MEKTKATFKTASPYQKDAMNLPVNNLEAALPFYQTIMGFHLISRDDVPHKSAILERDHIQIGLAENGGDPTQDGCFFSVDSVETAFEELRSNGLQKEISALDVQKYGNTFWKVFFVVAPDGLCYCIGERQPG
jgi:catechol 2,3-dioxygenase-like lactoylglutathione lyase family enzyme